MMQVQSKHGSKKHQLRIQNGHIKDNLDGMGRVMIKQMLHARTRKNKNEAVKCAKVAESGRPPKGEEERTLQMKHESWQAQAER